MHDECSFLCMELVLMCGHGLDDDAEANPRIIF